MKRYIFLVCISGTACALFDYDRAVGAAQKEQWAAAGEKFKSLVTAHPDQPDLLYDAGVVAFKNEDYEQANALFESAAQHKKAPRALKEQAYFNKANTHIKQEQLKEALSSYEQALMLNPENEQAKHNLEVVKKMLEQKEQQQQQEKQNQNKDKNKDQQNQKDKDNEQQKSDQSEKDNKDSQNQDCNDEQNQDQSQKDGQEGQDSKSKNGSEASKKDQQKQNQQKQNGNDKGLDQEGDQKDDERERPQEQERKPRQQQQRRRRNEPEKNSQKDKQREQQEKDDHNASLEKEKQQAEQRAQEQNMQAAEKEQGSGKEGFEPMRLDPALERVLARREDRDAQLNKQVIKALVGETAGQHGQNSW